MTSNAVSCQSINVDVLDRFSLEVTAKDAPQLVALAAYIPARTIVSVPFLATEQHSHRIAAAKAVRDAGYEPMPHIAARQLASEAELVDLISGWSEHGRVTRVLVLAGDADPPNGPYPDSASILRSRILEQYGIRHVSVAGHPEGHPLQDSQTLDAALAQKRALLEGAGFDWSITTQFTFASEPVLNWIARLRREGVDVPIRIGIPGPASVKTLLRFATLCGVSASTAVLRKYGLSLTQLLTSTGPDRLIEDYTRAFADPAYGDVRLHLYPFGGIAKTVDWITRYPSRG
ncbi:methylenetetrahydrofolate reductase [Pararhizobium sp. YC-54]|uniref:methylenetetrahydrofolate reductase n=1 Tax=Pararhizobium sp. YC-54 TaxID=2986920 RepID=UPI0021F71844|nr:methylenetetrahydrofolate reductase [Pararhizobium sp. YC-54]MCV9999299.1 methylenetetrahydrofolate reductase [Pararhizobium sp. YC-54]